MQSAEALFFANPFWSWVGIGGIFLIVELVTGSGWLLWPAAAAGVTGVAGQLLNLGSPMEVVLFAAAAIVFTYVGRRFLRPAGKSASEINDPAPRLIGREGEAAAGFSAGLGRVFVDGKEWAAELDGGGDLEPKSKVQVLEILGGAKLKVRAC
jgi:hypothetical protein